MKKKKKKKNGKCHRQKWKTSAHTRQKKANETQQKQ